MQTHDRKGMALGLVLMALFVITILILGAHWTSTQEFRLGSNQLVQNRAMSAAEYGHGMVYKDWDRSWNSFRAGTTFVRAYAPGDGSVDSVRVTKLNNLTFLAVSEGRAGTGVRFGARRRAGLLLRLNVPQVSVLGAITTRGTVKIGGSTAINGRDTSFAGWNCPPAGTPTAGVAVPSFSNITFGGGCPGGTCIQGTPLWTTPAAAADTNTYFNYGGMTWSELVAMADKTISGTVTGANPSYNGDGSCRTSDNKNFGDPNRAATPGKCESYFPIIYSPGDVTINGNVGQGVLLVGGSLNIQGGFTFYGPVIARGTVKLTGTGNHINGGVLAASVVDSTSGSTLLGNSSIQFSRCAMTTALQRTALPVKAPQRSWTELY